MTSIIYDVAPYAGMTGSINYSTATVKVMLATSSYTPAKTHAHRSDITNEASGTGYTAGGTAATVTVTNDTTNNRCDISLGAASWSSATISAAYAIYYNSRGGAASADEVIACIDLGGTVTSTGGTFSLTSSIYRTQL